MDHPAKDSGREFEVRALTVARARHDPLGFQGAIMFRGRETDGVFVDDTSVNVYEFTADRTKAKIEKDARKVAELVTHFSQLNDHRYKSIAGYCVTRDEPTAEQRETVGRIAQSERVSIRVLSYLTLQRQLVDVERYINLREVAPFGSADFRIAGDVGPPDDGTYVEPAIRLDDDASATLNDVSDLIESGTRVTIVGDYGIGKSAASRQLFFRLRKRYFKRPDERKFPIHINLRDCIGLRTPVEILRRHAEEIGFAGGNGLISAWRAGQIHIILDGFDELVPTRWVGSVRDLTTVRWSALAPVRELIGETPAGCGIVISGRLQYFGSKDELAVCLGMPRQGICKLEDFDDARALELSRGVNLPEWLPTRPLAIAFYRRSISNNQADKLPPSAGAGWRSLIHMVARREAARVDSITADTFVALLARIGTLARIESGTQNSISMSTMRRAFTDVCGYEPEEAGLQALLRLPGLATNNGETQSEERRSFVDGDLADAAFAIDLARYIQAPYSESHPLTEDAAWATASDAVVHEVCTEELVQLGFEPGIIKGSIKRRRDRGQNDAVMADLIGVWDCLGAQDPKASISITEVIANRLVVSDDSIALGKSSWSSCAIDVLDVSGFVDGIEVPKFNNSIIGRIDGWADIPTEFVSNFGNCEIVAYSPGVANVSEIMELDLDAASRVALSILRKVFVQRGSARKLSALSRGLPHDLRPLVSSVLDVLVSEGFVEKVDGKGDLLVHGLRARRKAVADYFDAPARINELFERQI